MNDDWKKEYSSSSEQHAKQELMWFRNHVSAREYLLVSRSVRDELDDKVPF